MLLSLDARESITDASPIWAYHFDQLDLKLGERILQVGEELGTTPRYLPRCGRKDCVRAIEFEKRLADVCASALRGSKWMPQPQRRGRAGEAIRTPDPNLGKG